MSRDVIYLGRGVNFPIALEGAEAEGISYIHAEGYAVGGMKHGPIALLERGVPVVMVAPHDEWFEKTSSNLKEALARGARVVLLSMIKELKVTRSCDGFLDAKSSSNVNSHDLFCQFNYYYHGKGKGY